MVKLATKTLKAIDDSIESDQGDSYRKALKEIILSFDDVYRPQGFPFRKHLGASAIGDECARKLWYKFRWFKDSSFNSRMLRLFNRGHLEESRLVAMLLSSGIDVRYQTEEGEQFKISEKPTHFAGSCDGIAYNVPDLPESEPCLLEYKTMKESEYLKLCNKGLRKFKTQHYVQMQVYMKTLKLKYALYLAVNKNDDSIYGEIIDYDEPTANFYLQRGKLITIKTDIPKRMHESPGWYLCKFCDYHSICHLDSDYNKNCRTCENSITLQSGKWACSITNTELDLDMQLDGCEKWKSILED